MKDACVNFHLGRDWFSLPLEQVREISPAGRIAPVPLAPPVVRGITNWRGRVITLIDVATVFDRPLPPARAAVDRLALILADPFGHLGLYVHAPVEIGEAVTGEVQPRVMQAGIGHVGSGGSGGSDAAGGEVEETGRLTPDGSLVTVAGRLTQMLCARDLIAHCEVKVIESFRRKT